MLIKNLLLLKDFNSCRLLHKFPQKCWKKRSKAAVDLGGVQAGRHQEEEGHWLVVAKAEGIVFKHFERLINLNNCWSVERFCFTRTLFRT